MTFYASGRTAVSVFLCPPRRLVCVRVTGCRGDFSPFKVIGAEKGGTGFIFESTAGAAFPLKYRLQVSVTEWPLTFMVTLVLTEQKWNVVHPSTGA